MSEASNVSINELRGVIGRLRESQVVENRLVAFLFGVEMRLEMLLLDPIRSLLRISAGYLTQQLRYLDEPLL